jgi:hypothetical protein
MALLGAIIGAIIGATWEWFADNPYAVFGYGRSIAAAMVGAILGALIGQFWPRLK